MKKQLIFALTLTCMAPAWAVGAPEGNYTRDCRNIKMVGTTLQASCKLWYTTWIQVKGRNVETPAWGEAKLENADSCGYVENQQGTLVCLRQRNDPTYDKKKVYTPGNLKY